MAADMLAAYYDRSTDTDALFRNLKIGRSETYKKHRNQYDVIKINMQEFLSATSGIDEMLRMLNDYLIFDLREQYSQVRFRDEKNLVQVMKDLTYDNERENVSTPNREVSQEYINAISRFPFCNTTMKTRCGRIFLSLFSVPACSVRSGRTRFSRISMPLRHCICYISFRGQLPVRRRSCISGMAIKRCRSVEIKLRI